MEAVEAQHQNRMSLEIWLFYIWGTWRMCFDVAGIESYSLVRVQFTHCPCKYIHYSVTVLSHLPGFQRYPFLSRCSCDTDMTTGLKTGNKVSLVVMWPNEDSEEQENRPSLRYLCVTEVF